VTQLKRTMSSQEHPEELNLSMLPPDIRDRIYYDYVSLYMNNKMKVVHEEIISNHPFFKKDKIKWELLSKNPNTIELLIENPEKIDWYRLSHNPNAIDLLKTNLDKIDCVELSRNPNAMDLLKANQEKIDWYMLSRNPAVSL